MAYLSRLHKIPPTTSDESLDEVLQTLWRTRKSGLGSSEKTRIRSLLDLSSFHDLDLVLPALRLLIRKSVHESMSGDEMRKMFSLDFSGELMRVLVTLLMKYQNEWKEEALRDQPLWQQTRVSNQVKLHVQPAVSQSRLSELSSLWPRRESTIFPNNSNSADRMPACNGPTIPRVLPVPCNEDNQSSNNVANIPCLKSMTWTMETRGSTTANRVAVITLKLQGHSKSTSGETEVKFQLSKDTIELMLSSMTNIREQFSNSGVSEFEPPSEKQR